MTTEIETTGAVADIGELHRLELEAAPTKTEQIRYAARVLGPDTTYPQVRDWLAGYGIEASKSTICAQIAKVKGQRGGNGPDTSDLPKLTREQMDALEAEFSRTEEATETAVAAEVVPPAESLPAIEAAEAGPVAGESGRTDTPEPAPEADPVRAEVRSDALESDSGPSPVRLESESGPSPVRSESESGPSPVRSESDWSEVVRSESDGGPVRSEVRSDVSPVRSEESPVGPDSVRSESDRSESGPIGPAPVRSESDGGPVRSEVRSDAGPDGPDSESEPAKKIVLWPVLLMALSAFVAVWSGWVGLGEMTGFGEVKPLPGIAPDFTINSAITLPIGVEAYAAYAMYVWLGGRAQETKTVAFAKWSSIGALLLGAAGQVAYHLLEQANMSRKTEAQQVADAAAAANGQEAAEVILHAPWWITTFVSCLPVVVLGLGAALAHMVLSERDNKK